MCYSNGHGSGTNDHSREMDQIDVFCACNGDYLAKGEINTFSNSVIEPEVSILSGSWTGKAIMGYQNIFIDRKKRCNELITKQKSPDIENKLMDFPKEYN